MMKRMSILVMILAILIAALPVSGQGNSPAAYDSYDELVVGNPTHLEGNFFTDMWGDNTADLDVRMLLHGYNLVGWESEEGRFAFDPTVVNGITVTENEAGDRTYHISLYSDLQFSDGTMVRAQDYVFSFLFQIAPEIAELGGKPLRIEHIVGYEEYNSGESDVLSGIRLADDTQFAITIRHEYLPFFYELGLLYCTPVPMHVIAPGCEVRDNGRGVYIEGPFSADLLRRTVLDPERGYLSHPTVVSGPYMLTAYDGTTAEFEVNPLYKGNSEGITPAIQRIKYTVAQNETMMEELRKGQFGLLNKVTLAEAVEQGRELIGSGKFAVSNYPRMGLTFISFSGERAAVSSQAVRQAIAYAMDRDAMVREYVGPNGLRADGFYGLGQWMYQLVSGTLSYEIGEPENPTYAEQLEYSDKVRRLGALSLDGIRVYEQDIEESVLLLEWDGWTLDRTGGRYEAGTDDVRCRNKDGELVCLDLKLAYPSGNRMAGIMEEYMIPGLAEAGIRVTLEPRSMEEILDIFYRRTARDCDMVYLGTNFDIVFDLSAHFIPGEDGKPTWNYTEMEDERLYDLAVAMRHVEPGDVLSYCEYWLQFQEQFSEVLPMIPIYSNIYFDFYPTALHNYEIGPEATWTQAILSAYMDHIPGIDAEADAVEDEITEPDIAGYDIPEADVTEDVIPEDNVTEDDFQETDNTEVEIPEADVIEVDESESEEEEGQFIFFD